MSKGNPKNKKFFKLPKPVDQMTEEELQDFCRFVAKAILGDDEETSDES